MKQINKVNLENVIKEGLNGYLKELIASAIIELPIVEDTVELKDLVEKLDALVEELKKIYLLKEDTDVIVSVNAETINTFYLIGQLDGIVKNYRTILNLRVDGIKERYEEDVRKNILKVIGYPKEKGGNEK